MAYVNAKRIGTNLLVPVVNQTILVDKTNVYIAIVIQLVMDTVIVKKIALMIVFNATVIV